MPFKRLLANSFLTLQLLTDQSKVAAILQTTFWNAFSWMKMYKFRLIFHLSLFLSFQLTTIQHSLQWRHNGCGSVSNHQPHDCSLNRWFRRRSKKTSKLRVTSLCAGNSPGTGEMASNAEMFPFDDFIMVQIMMVSLLMHICVTRPRWVNTNLVSQEHNGVLNHR